MLKLVEFIKSNPNWEYELTQKPYCITIKRKDNFIIFNYSQIDSDFFNPIVKECRGIILDDIYKPVCVPFYKFHNHGEGYAETIDWNTARVQEKVDGSIIKVWNYNNEWHISTNGTIDAKDAEIQSDISPYKNFYELFIKASENSNLNINNLDKNFTYMFELISIYNRVVVPYFETEIRHIGTRNNNTLEECDVDIKIEKPKSFSFTSLDECISMATSLPFSEEGYVVVDNNWHRVKIKSPVYVAAHHLKNNGVVTKSRIVELIRINEHEEFLNYYPEFKEMFYEVLIKIIDFKDTVNECLIIAEAKKNDNRKEFAMYATKTICPAFLFNWLDGKYQTIDEWLWNQTDEKIVQWIGVKND